MDKNSRSSSSSRLEALRTSKLVKKRKIGTGRLQGKITDVGPQLTEAQLASSCSRYYKNPCLCGNPDCSSTKTGETQDIIDKYGAVHGQEVKAVVSLPETYVNHVPIMAFFRGNKTRYSVTLRMNDNKENMVRCISFIFLHKYVIVDALALPPIFLYRYTSNMVAYGVVIDAFYSFLSLSCVFLPQLSGSSAVSASMRSRSTNSKSISIYLTENRGNGINK